MVPAPVAARPDKDTSLPTPTTGYSLDESSARQLAWTVHGFAIIIRSPGGAVDVDMLVVETQAPGLHGIGDIAVEHPHTADPAVEGHADAADRVVGTCRDFPSTSGAMSGCDCELNKCVMRTDNHLFELLMS